MRASGKVLSHISDGGYGEFLYNEDAKTAVFLKFVIKLAKRGFKTKRNRSYKNPHDHARRITTTTVGRNAISHFLNHPQFKSYDLVVPVGSHIHEACLFIRKMGEFMFVIYYNPNFSQKTQGTQANKVFKELVVSLGKNITSVKSFHSRFGNYAGKCSILTWERIFAHVVDGKSPFKNEKLKLYNYDHLATEYSYEKYHRPNTGDVYVYEHFDMWENLDKLLLEFGASDEDVRKIASFISATICDHFDSK